MEDQLPQAVEFGHESVAIILSGDVIPLAEAPSCQSVIEFRSPEPGLPAPINQLSRIRVPHLIDLVALGMNASGAPEVVCYGYFIGWVDVRNLGSTSSGSQ
jgi:hypothetical protein